jgi:hypothetical protein
MDRRKEKLLLRDKAIQVHGDTIDLSQANFQTWAEKVTIGCKVCDHWWTVTPNNLILRKSKCPKCSMKKRINKPHTGKHHRNVRKTTCEFVNEAIAKHGDKYDYTQTVYVTQCEHVEIICRQCNLNFKQTPVMHLHGNAGRGNGCPRCARNIVASSCIEKEWLDKIGVPLERRQDWISLDGRSICVDALWKNTVYEFLGKFWHGDPRQYNHAKLNKLAGKTFGELYNNTVERINKLSLLFNVVYVWEIDYHKGLMISYEHPIP